MNPEQDLGFRYRPIQKVEQQELNQPSQPNQPTEFRSRPIHPKNKKPGLAHKPTTSIQELPRQLTQYASRGVEAIASIPRQIAELGLSERSGLDEDMYTAPGRRMPKERAIDAAKEREILSNIGIKNPEELKEFSEKITGGYTKPQSGKEEFVGNVVGDVTSLLANPSKAKLPFAKSFATALAGNSAKEIVGAFGGGETAQNLTKIGTMILAGAVNRDGAKNYVKSEYKRAEKLLPATAETNFGTLGSRLNRMTRELLKGKGKNSPEKAAVLTTIEDIHNKATNGKIKIDELVAFKRDINNQMGNFETLKGSKKFLIHINKLIDNQLNRYGTTHNPEWLDAHTKANAGFAALARSKKLSDGIETLVKGHKTISSLGIGGTVIASTFGFLPVSALPAAAGIYGGVKTAELAYRATMKDPTLRNYYLNILKESAKGNSTAAAKILTKYNERLEKEVDIKNNLPRRPGS